MGLTFAGVYERPEQPWLESQNARSYMQQDDGDMEPDYNARSYMEQEDVNEIPEEGDDDFAEVETHYQNNWDGDLHFECPSDGAINKFQSIHSNKKEDRLWRFDCKYVGSFYCNAVTLNHNHKMLLRLVVLVPAAGILELTSMMIL